MQPYFSEELKSLINGLLMTDADERLGSSDSDSEEIKKHPFFRYPKISIIPQLNEHNNLSDVDWGKMERKECVPPLQLNLKDEYDLKYFENVTQSCIQIFIGIKHLGISE